MESNKVNFPLNKNPIYQKIEPWRNEPRDNLINELDVVRLRKGTYYQGLLVYRNINGRLPIKEEAYYIDDKEPLPKGLKPITNLDLEKCRSDTEYLYQVIEYFGRELG